MTEASGDGHTGSRPASPPGIAAHGPSTGPVGGDAWEWSTPRTFTVSGYFGPPPSSAFDDLIGTKVSVTGTIFGDAEGEVVGWFFTYEGADPRLELEVRFTDGRTGTVAL